VAKVLDGVGHVASVGDWRDNVRELMPNAKAVVLRYDANDTRRFWWEVKELIERGVPPTRVLVWFAQEHHIPFDMFTVHFNELLPVKFPSSGNGQVQFVYFDEQWNRDSSSRASRLRRFLSPGIDVDAFYIDSQIRPFFMQNQQTPPRLAFPQIMIVVGAIVLSTGLWVYFQTR
jgi:hypothetical protein